MIMKDQREVEKKLMARQNLEAQMRAREQARARGLDGVGGGVTTVEWEINRSLRGVSCRV